MHTCCKLHDVRFPGLAGTYQPKPLVNMNHVPVEKKASAIVVILFSLCLDRINFSVFPEKLCLSDSTAAESFRWFVW